MEQLQRAQIAALQSRVRELERRAAAAGPAGDATPLTRPKLHDFTDADLQAMAHNCQVRFDLPHIAREPYHLMPDKGARLHLSDPEQERVSTAVEAVSKDAVAHLRAFYFEATGDAAGADTLDPQSQMREILEKSPAAAVQAAQTEIAASGRACHQRRQAPSWSAISATSPRWEIRCNARSSPRWARTRRPPSAMRWPSPIRS